jgi:hypothetical protein
MKSVSNFLVAILLITPFSCDMLTNESCLKHFIGGHKFSYPDKLQEKELSYLKFNKNVLEEYVDGKLQTTCRVTWVKCNEYNLVVEKIHTDQPLHVQVGDRATVTLMKRIQDTIYFTLTAGDRIIEYKYVRIE